MKKIPLIWNITRACPWNCSFCCTSSYPFYFTGEEAERELNNLKEKGIELSLEDKLKIVDNLDLPVLEIDVSGGEPLLFKENTNIIRKLSEKLGKENISITTTGKGLENISVDELKEIVKIVDFTYDFPYEPNNLRPENYNSHNLELIKRLTKRGIKANAQIPLTTLNNGEQIIRGIYKNLSRAGVESLFLMKFFPVGRGKKRIDLMLSEEDYQKAVDIYKNLENAKGPKVKLQTALKKDNLGKHSINMNITSKGLLTSDPWAYNLNGSPIKKYILGDLKYKKISELLKFKYLEKI